MRTNDYIKAVDEIKSNGGTRETMYIRETWKDRCMTIFGYTDGTCEVFEGTQPYMVFNSVAEATHTLNKMQADYNEAVAASNARWKKNSLKIDYYSIDNYYGRAGVYYGD
jgi:hypothetical protein